MALQDYIPGLRNNIARMRAMCDTLSNQADFGSTVRAEQVGQHGTNMRRTTDTLVKFVQDAMREALKVQKQRDMLLEQVAELQAAAGGETMQSHDVDGLDLEPTETIPLPGPEADAAAEAEANPLEGGLDV